MFYYFIAYKELKKLGKPLVVSVPSGNFGNICAGMMAKKIGLPIAHFVASTNVNDTVPRFMDSQQYEPKPTVETLSNAMDVSNPSNFVRILELFGKEFGVLDGELTSYSFTDAETVVAMQKVYTEDEYLCDPHGAVGYLGLKKYLKGKENLTGIFLETAHPVKFADSIVNNLKIEIPIPEQIQAVLNGEKKATKISTYNELKDFLKHQ